MSRIETRESAVIFIYQSYFRESDPAKEIDRFISENPKLEEDKDYFVSLSMGVIRSKEELDEKISSFLINWSLDRIAKLDRAVLEVAFYEILHMEDIPLSVSINEAVRLSKKYGNNDSSKYINGILSKFEKSLGQ